MKLLLDENLSRRLVPFLQDAYPGSSQVVLLGLESASDLTIWEYARSNGFVIVSRDADFEQLSASLGQPPQIVWLNVQNQSKAAVLNLLINNRQAIETALEEDRRTCIELRMRTQRPTGTSE
jgi:predicted nuclease of predicted toxin-antitoxin system